MLAAYYGKVTAIDNRLSSYGVNHSARDVGAGRSHQRHRKTSFNCAN